VRLTGASNAERTEHGVPQTTRSLTKSAGAVDPDIEAWIDQIQPEDMKDALHHRAIIAAVQDAEAADQKLREAVAAARAAGEKWAEIGMALGVSRQAAQQRFSSKS
jgi:hypothetical protein